MPGESTVKTEKGGVSLSGIMYVDQQTPVGSGIEYGPDGDIQKIDQPATDNAAMSDYWNKVEAIIDGVDTVRAGKKIYLPEFPREDLDDYKYRLASSTMTNVYRDIVESLSSKPFSQEVKVTKGDSAEIKLIVENINGRGDHMHVFLGETFFRGINSAIQWILVDYPTVELATDAPPRSVEDEKKLGLRPYWVQVRAKDVLDVKTQNITGVEELSYVRIWETAERVRVFDKRTGTTVFRIYLKDMKTAKWRLDTSGPVTINVIPMVPFQTGRRKGATWQFYPPMRDAADLQIESYQAESALKYARILTAYSMLGANGIDPPMEADGVTPKPIRMGPNVVLYAPPNGDGTAGEWVRLVADAAGIKILMDDVKARHEQMREIGRQPLTAQSGNVTRISAAFAASKSNSAVQAWAFGLKDAAEQALKITNAWMNSTDEPEVFVFTDFKVESDDNKVPGVLLSMRAARDLSQETYWKEMQGQGVLSANFDVAAEPALIALEGPTDVLATDPSAGAIVKPGKPAPSPKPTPKL